MFWCVPRSGFRHFCEANLASSQGRVTKIRYLSLDFAVRVLKDEYIGWLDITVDDTCRAVSLIVSTLACAQRTDWNHVELRLLFQCRQED